MKNGLRMMESRLISTIPTRYFDVLGPWLILAMLSVNLRDTVLLSL